MISLLILFTNLSFASQVKFDTGNVNFLAIGRPSAIKIKGHGTALHGQFAIQKNSLTGKANFDLACLDTGIKMRDEHMKEKYLETGKFPQSTFTVTKLAAPEGFFAKPGKAAAIPFEGTLSVHGVEKPVQGKADLDNTGSALAANCSFQIKISDYAIAKPSFSGITMAEDVDVSVNFNAPITQ